jgi:ribosomal subunit interface protein
MIFNLKTTNIICSDSLRDLVEHRFKGLIKYAPKLTAMHVEIGKTTKHRRQGKIFFAEVNATLPGGMVRAEHIGEDIEGAIDKVEDTLKLKLKKQKTIQRSLRRGLRNAISSEIPSAD